MKSSPRPDFLNPKIKKDPTSTVLIFADVARRVGEHPQLKLVLDKGSAAGFHGGGPDLVETNLDELMDHREPDLLASWRSNAGQLVT